MKHALAFLSGLGALAVLGLFIAGCGKTEKPPVAAVANGQSHDATEHGHAKGTEALGDYHARIAVEQGGVLRLFILGKDETKVASIEEQEVAGLLQAEGEPQGVRIILKADRQTGDPPGKTSQFLGTVPEALRGKALIADLRVMINGDPYRPRFASVPGSGHNDDGHSPPKGVTADNERELFLTPGGIYTAADIQANGNTTPSQKFKGKQFHMLDDQEPELRSGDKICPITNNRSNPQCTWIVNGKEYEFCCPPCLNKFVALAKKQSQKIKAPEAYVHKE
jgi:hypothetical protein